MERFFYSFTGEMDKYSVTLVNLHRNASNKGIKVFLFLMSNFNSIMANLKV